MSRRNVKKINVLEFYWDSIKQIITGNRENMLNVIYFLFNMRLRSMTSLLSLIYLTKRHKSRWEHTHKQTIKPKVSLSYWNVILAVKIQVAFGFSEPGTGTNYCSHVLYIRFMHIRKWLLTTFNVAFLHDIGVVLSPSHFRIFETI